MMDACRWAECHVEEYRLECDVLTISDGYGLGRSYRARVIPDGTNCQQLYLDR